jgi:hypothetical protein
MLAKLKNVVKLLLNTIYVRLIGHCLLIMLGLALLMEATNIDLIENQHPPHIILSDWLAVVCIFAFYSYKFLMGIFKLIKSIHENNKPDFAYRKGLKEIQEGDTKH